MKLQLKTPIEIAGKIFENVLLSLSISSNQNNIEEYMFACSLTPYRIDEEGNVEKLEAANIPMSVINIMDSQYQVLGTELLTALQNQLNKA